MPRTTQLAQLFRDIAARNWEGAEEAARLIAKEEEDAGHRSSAQALFAALTERDVAEQSQSSAALSLGKTLVRIPDDKDLDQLQLRPAVRNSLAEIILEWKASRALQQAGVPRRNRLLFHGPPGCGKTATASALAKEMKMPAYVVQFDSLIGAYLGQTAANLKEVFHFATHQKCVLVFDEIDVLAKKRGNQMDVGELDRIVVGLMQQLDWAAPKGVIIGASNLYGQLDPALVRRFDLVVEFKAPTKNELVQFLGSTSKRLGFPLSRKMKDDALVMKDFASAEKMLKDELRRRIARGIK